MEALHDAQCAIMDQIVRMPANALGGMAKRELWQVTHDHYDDQNEALVMSAVVDLKALSSH